MMGKAKLRVVCCLIALMSLLLVGAIPALTKASSDSDTPIEYAVEQRPVSSAGPKITEPTDHATPVAPKSGAPPEFYDPLGSPRDLETLAKITIIAGNKPPYDPGGPEPDPSGSGQPWKPYDKGNDLTVQIQTNDVSQVFNDTKDAGVWFKCTYELWDGTSSFYKVKMTVTGNMATVIMGGNQATNFLVIGGTRVHWFINATCDAWTPKARLSDYHDYTVGGIWAAKDFSANVYFNTSTAAPILGESVIVSVEAKDLQVKPGVFYPTAMLREAILSVDVTYPDSSMDSFQTAMMPNGTDSKKKYFEIPGDYNMKPGTIVKLTAIIIAYAGYDWYFTLSTTTPKSYTVSNIGNFPKNTTFDKYVTVTTDPDVITLKKINASVDVNVSVKAKDDSKGNPIPIFAQIFYWINVTDESPLNGIEAMNKYSANERYFKIPGVTPSFSETIVRFWVTVMDNAGQQLSSRPYEYRIYALVRDSTKIDLDVFIVQAIDDLQKIGIKGAPVVITSTDFSLESKTNDMGTLVPHEQNNPQKIHWCKINKTYIINVTYPLIGMAHDIAYLLDKNPKPGTVVLAGRDFQSDRKSNWSIVLYVNKDKMRTLKFIFNYYSAKPLVFADVQPFPDFPIEYLTYATVIILLIPVVILLDKRRKKAEEEEKRVTL